MSTDLSVVPARSAPVQAGFFNLDGFELMQRVAKGFASSSLVPEQYRGNVANTMIALSMAQRIGADPMAVMQQLYIVHGRPSWSSKFLIATFNACGRFSAMRFRFRGDEQADDWSCQAYAVEKATGEEVHGSWVSIAMAKAEGWYQKNGSKWKTMPQQMLIYRAASFMVNTVAPELSMGLVTAEEADDIIDVTPTAPAASVDALNARLAASAEPAAPSEPAEPPAWPAVDPDTGELVDARGIAWDERIHSSSRACTEDGTWRRRRGADPELVRRIEAQTPAADPLPADTRPEPGYEDIREGMASAATEDDLNAWLDTSRQVLITQSQRATLDLVYGQRMRDLVAAQV